MKILILIARVACLHAHLVILVKALQHEREKRAAQHVRWATHARTQEQLIQSFVPLVTTASRLKLEKESFMLDLVPPASLVKLKG